MISTSMGLIARIVRVGARKSRPIVNKARLEVISWIPLFSLRSGKK